ncbi:MAG: hypothetical protein EOP22_05875 [Hyphomicrobiales bacterium]|nr:MAG: hypothetical protein EOP22_05875 [Hyphomicrobiales bacterium]
MAVIFYILGILLVRGGIWTAAIAAQPLPVGEYAGYAMLGRIVAIAPGISVIVGGFLFLAIGRGLNLLYDIARAGERTADLLDEQFGQRKR